MTTQAIKLQSFSNGEWHTPANDGSLVNNAITGEAVALVSSEGLDFKDMVDYARNIGGPALRKYSFHQRAIMLKELGAYLLKRKELFYELSLIHI